MTTITKFFQFILAGALALSILPVREAFSSARYSVDEPQSPLQADTSCDSTRTVVVNGAATINVTPDRALVRLGVQSNATTIDAVELANTKAIQNVIKSLLKLGIAEKDISTDIYVVEPVYESYDSLFIKGYRINNQVAVTIRDVKITSKTISTALKAGANQVNNVEFYTSELRKYRDQARDLAVQAAREKAEAISAKAGAKAGCIIQLSENSWASYSGWWSGGNSSLWSQNVIQNINPNPGTGTGGDEPVSLGLISVKAEINATFSLE